MNMSTEKCLDINTAESYLSFVIMYTLDYYDYYHYINNLVGRPGMVLIVPTSG